MKKVLMMTAVLMLMAVPSAAQQPTQDEIDKYIELIRIDVRQERSELVGAAMQLSAGQAAKFWPIYEKYEAAFTALGDTKLKLIGDYADVFAPFLLLDGLLGEIDALLEVFPAKPIATGLQRSRFPEPLDGIDDRTVSRLDSLDGLQGGGGALEIPGEHLIGPSQPVVAGLALELIVVGEGAKARQGQQDQDRHE